MRILITGGAGFIGRHISEHFQHRAEVRVLDNLRSGFKRNLSGLECQLIVGSILDRDLVREAMKGVDFVFHLAAMVSVPGSVQRPSEYDEINAGGTAIVLEEATRARAKKLIFSSSAAIYGHNPRFQQLKACRPSRKVRMPQASMKANGIAAPSRMKGDSPLFPFVILTSLVPTRTRELNTPRPFPLFLRKQSGTSRLRFSETAEKGET